MVKNMKDEKDEKEDEKRDEDVLRNPLFTLRFGTPGFPKAI
jgi:hypothetical protein